MRTATTTKKPRRTVEVLNAGAHRGARENLDAFARWNRESTSVTLVPRYIDPVLGRAELMKAEAIRHGVPAEAEEGTIEATILEEDAKGKPIVLNLDRPEAIAKTILAAEHTNAPILGYLLLKLPSGQLWGIRFYLRPGDNAGRLVAVKFFHRLGELTARRGSAAVLGAEGDVAHRAAEARYRHWFADHLRDNIGKLLAGIAPTGHTFEITDDGATTYALIVRDSETWSEPRTLAESVAADPPVPIVRGESWVIGEVTPEGVRFHKVRRRQADDKVALQGLGVIDNHAVDAERAGREAAEALARAERETLSRRSPVLSTD